MRKEYIFFFILIGVSAMITGFTVGFVANYSFIQQQIDQQKIQSTNHQESPDGQTSKEETSQPKEENKANDNPADKKSDAASGIVVEPQVDGTVRTVSLSPSDLQSVNAMLDNLGIPETSSQEDRIRAFQTQNGLTSTGELDSVTLNVILHETVVKAAEQKYNGG